MISKLLTLTTLTLTLAGCILGEVDPQGESDTIIVNDEQPTHKSTFPYDSWYQPGCGYETLVLHDIDGTIFYMEIPLECDDRPEEFQGSGPVENPGEEHIIVESF